MTLYTDKFFEVQHKAVENSPQAIIPILLEYIPRPMSVVDVGCGTGEWLAEFQKLGAAILGLDGDYVARSSLRIAPEEFVAVDLTKPLANRGRFDLALCLEVAEHLPQRLAAPLVGSLCELAPNVLFSAAPPGQGGTHHINEQWPRYWQQLFRSNGYEMHDVIRVRIWENRAVAPWYRQNIFLCQKGPQVAPIQTRLHHEVFGTPTIRQSLALLRSAINTRFERAVSKWRGI
jgi:SAM-dependent methyltransferase